MQAGIRFAPSPTGRFHIGNLRTAWIAQWWAQALNEELILRSEDIDQPRNVSGAHELQIADLKELGIVPDRVSIQSARRNRHWELFQRAYEGGAIYPCICSRKEVQTALAGLASAPHTGKDEIGFLYAGTCRDPASRGAVQALPQMLSGTAIAWRFRNQDPSGRYDFLVGRTENLIPDLASFVPAYHWACAIDDWDGNYRLLVRAWDLATAVPIQRVLQLWLTTLSAEAGCKIFPAVFHTSLITQADGHRLEKRTKGVTLDELKQSGISPAEVIVRFQQSFTQPNQQFVAAQVWGETFQNRTLADIGF